MIKISFRAAKLTNNMVNDPNMIVLNSMHKYQPRILIVPAESIEKIAYAPTYSAYVFPSTEFVAVTAYQNQRVTKLKIAHNPFAKGFRERNSNQGGNRKRKPRDTEVTNLRAQLEMAPITLPHLAHIPNQPIMTEQYKKQRMTPSPNAHHAALPQPILSQGQAQAPVSQTLYHNQLQASPSSQSNSSFSSSELNITPTYPSQYLPTTATADHSHFTPNRPAHLTVAHSQPDYVGEYNLQFSNFEAEVNQGDYMGIISHETNPLSFALFN